MTKIKLLWLYRYIPSYDFDSFLHLKFVEYLSKREDIELLVYGPEIQHGYPHLVKVPYREELSIGQIYNEAKMKLPNYIICDTKSRMFMDYDPHPWAMKANGMWLPPDFSAVGIPRICLAEDSHYEKDNDPWFEQMKFDLILERHYSQSLRPHSLPVAWFPFSVDTNIFRPNIEPLESKRIKKLCFVGSYQDPAYRIRFSACNILKKDNINLIDVFAHKEKCGYQYVDCLRDYIGHLSCNSIHNLTSAKMFEIMASGSVLFTNDSPGVKELFPDNAYVSYKENMQNLVDKAKEICYNAKQSAEIAKAGVKCIQERHSHEVRTNELLNHLKNIKIK